MEDPQSPEELKASFKSRLSLLVPQKRTSLGLHADWFEELKTPDPK